MADKGDKKDSKENKDNKESKDAPKKEEKKEEPKLTPQQLLTKELRENCQLLQEAAAQKDRRGTARAVRGVDALRKRLQTVSGAYGIFVATCKEWYPEAEQTLNLVPAPAEPAPAAAAAPASMDTSDDAPAAAAPAPSAAAAAAPAAAAVPLASVAPEVKIYLQMMATGYVLDRGANAEALKAVVGLVAALHTHNRRTLDLLSARVYRLWALVAERNGKLQEIRTELLATYRTACLQHNEPGQASLINALLRSYLLSNMVEQADSFRLNARFPETASNNQHTRFLYYTGYIQAIKLQYSDAFASLQEALRKAPMKAALGFRQAATKLLFLVQLLLGEIPERSLFFVPELRRSLRPYLKLTQAVRVGNLENFDEVMGANKEQFTRDGTLSLIVRLRHNVIKTGLKKINQSYSRISLKDLCDKLKIASEEDAEYIVAKAIHDGVIDAVIDRKGRFVYSKENPDIYSSTEPQAAFDKRIDFCIKLHNEAVKALTYPGTSHKVKYELLEDDRDDEAEMDADTAKEKVDDEDED